MTVNDEQSRLVTIARTSGIWYLCLAVSGILGFMVYHSQVYDADPQQTVTNLVEGITKARLRLLLEFMIIVSQALTAIWFYRLFRNINEWAALATAIWGTVNAIAIMVSAISMGSAIKIAQSSQLMEDKIVLIDLLTSLISNAWSVGGLFFGLWLIPLGYIITSSGRMPVWLGRTLILGGIGYLASTTISYAGVSGSWVGSLTIPATIGEFWMIGYLLIFGIRPVNK
ncbi:DUF4386 domain-containing protein [Muriicola sp. Z0-33]|uniref:DUF4386 domain-containing protein n=1 Tax=Muriicola sp. Z0-33 TaxID=2816957 RepID=UPI002237084A|nr:DUF4386 domain-containing protein [Muriicola sp. Z0-33]MCW5517949.1 DUF4386 domain-containing protein [Muriicola sp. Z0-33]